MLSKRSKAVMDFMLSLWNTAQELAPWLFLGAAISALMHRFLPPGFIRRHLSGYGGVLKAVGLGVPLPLCSCGVIPAGIGLKKDGASDGSSIAFLISTPQTGVDSVLVSAAFLGWPFALFKVGSAALTGIVGGGLVELTSRGKPETETAAEETSGGAISQPSWKAAGEHGIQLLRSIWGWLLFGMLLSAAIEALVPGSMLSALPAGWSSLAALAVSVPLYVCATASVPIAAALVAGGLPLGAALVFLMAGPATNAATIGAVRKEFGGRATAIYLSTVVIGSMGLGTCFDFLLAPAAVEGHAGMDHQTWWGTLSAALLGLSICAFAIEEALHRMKVGIGREAGALSVEVEGMSCQGCVRKLERMLGENAEIEEAEVQLSPGRAVVQGSISQEALIRLVSEAGFEAKAQ
jgi:uncharacterized protein